MLSPAHQIRLSCETEGRLLHQISAILQERTFKGAAPCQASMSTAGAQTSSRVEEMFKMMDESNSSQGEGDSQMLYEGRVD